MFGEKLAWIIGVGTGYSWFHLSFFVLLLPCVTHSSCSLPTGLCLLEKRNKLRLFCGAQVFFFPLLLSSVTRTSRSLPACLRLTEKRWEIAPVLQIQASSMKLRVHGFLFLVSFLFLSLYEGVPFWKRALRPDSFLFFNDSDIFLNIWILIITSLAIHYSQNVFRGFPILVCKGVQVVFRGFIFHSSSRTWLALALAARLPPFDPKKHSKFAPVLQIQASSMKLRVHGFLFLVFLHNIFIYFFTSRFFITISTFRYYCHPAVFTSFR